MYTECPECQTYFKITPDQLKAAEGKVRCGNCDHVFNALTNLAEQVPSANAPDENVETSDISELEIDIPDSVSSAVEVAEKEESALALEDGPESVIAFHVSDPESEAALSEISLPEAEAMSLAENNSVVSEKDELSLEGIGGLSALADIEKTPAVSEAALSVFSSEIDMPSKKSDTSSVKTELSGFSALESMMADAEPEANLEDNKSEMQSQLSELSISGLEGDDLASANTSESLSYADVDVPGVESDSVVPDNNLDDINKDIDDALDNLFDEELLDEAPHAPSGPAVKDSSVSQINDLSGLDEILDEIDGIDESVEKGSSLDFQSDAAPSFNLAEDDKEVAKKEPEFSLDDSFLDNPLKSETTDWEPFEGKVKDEDAFSKDNYRLEELQENRSETTGGTSRILWVFVISGLFIVLLGQFAYLKREELAKYPAMIPVMEAGCAVIGMMMDCEVPEVRDVQAIVIVERNVVSHPNAKNALLINSIIKNDAKFDQKYPDLVLTFSNISQEVLARRTFKPEEYLSKSVDIQKGMKAGVPIKIMLEIVDPGEAAVNFNFDFR